jgi:hypothetical protein
MIMIVSSGGTGYLRDDVGITTGVPQVAAESLWRPSRQPWAKTGLVGTRRRDTGSFLRPERAAFGAGAESLAKVDGAAADRYARRRQLATCPALMPSVTTVIGLLHD